MTLDVALAETAAPPPRRARRRSPLLAATLVLPIGYSVVFFLAPLLFLILLGFWSVENYQLVPGFSLANYADIASNMFAGSQYGLAIAQSLYVSITTAVFAVALCYLLVLAIVFNVPAHLQRLVLLLAVAPFWTSYILRVFAWQILLAKRGIINTGFSVMGLDWLQQGFLNTQIATRIGLIHYLAPILVVILYVTVINIDTNLIDAARQLGATRWQAFRRVTLPLSRVGIILALSFAAIVSFGDVLSGSLLGGGAGRSLLGTLPLFSNMVMSDYASSTNLPHTSALAMILVAVMVVILLIGFGAAERAQRSIS